MLLGQMSKHDLRGELMGVNLDFFNESIDLITDLFFILAVFSPYHTAIHPQFTNKCWNVPISLKVKKIKCVKENKHE